MSIQCDRITYAFNQVAVIDDFSFKMPDKGVVGISGPSGCGKTTLLHLLAGLISPQSGHIRDSRRGRIGMVFQEDRLLPWLTNEGNILLVCDDPQIAHDWMSKIEMEHARAQFPDELSGGMRRRVALARALAFDSDLLLLDEPFQGMDHDLRQRLYPLVRQAAEDKPVLVVSHDLAELDQLTDTLLLASGPPLRLIRA